MCYPFIIALNVAGAFRKKKKDDNYVQSVFDDQSRIEIGDDKKKI